MKLLICTQVVDKNHPILGFFHRWIEEFAKHFDEVHVICLEKGEHTLPSNVKVYSLGKEEGESRVKYILRFYKFFSHIFFIVRVDFVFFHMGAIYNIIAAPFFFLRIFFYTKFYWWKTHGHIDVVGRIALWFVDRVYTAVEESFPIISAKRYVIGHAIDTEIFNFRFDNPKSLTLLFVGRLSRSKRVEHVLRICSNLEAQGVIFSAQIIGEVMDISYYEELQKLSKDLGINEKVLFIGSVPHEQLPKYYHAATAFINPSDSDGMDKVVLEAMACGLIPVTGNASFVRMLSPYALAIEKGNIERYTTCVMDVMSKSRNEYLVLARELRKLVVEDHSMSSITHRIFNI